MLSTPHTNDAAIALTRAELPSAWAGQGCPACRGRGHRGRTGIYDLLMMDEELRAALQQDVSAGQLARLAVDRGMRLLLDDGLRQVRAGLTTVKEVLRVAIA